MARLSGDETASLPGEITFTLNEAEIVRVFGSHDKTLRAFEARFPRVRVTTRGNIVSLLPTASDHDSRDQLAEAAGLFEEIMRLVRAGYVVTAEELELIAQSQERRGAPATSGSSEVIVESRGRLVRAKTLGQARYVQAIDTHTITFGIGPAGTGKTYLAMAKAVQALQRKEVDRIILTRPAVEAGERLGFLPGTLTEKIDPYLRPLFDALAEMLDPELVAKLCELGTIEVAPLAYMRGRTLNKSFIVLDEAQNTSPEQMKMFLTRLGFDSKMVVTGDITQVDVPTGVSGLRTVTQILSDVSDIHFAMLGSEDVVRHSLVGQIVDAYTQFEELQLGRRGGKK